MNSFLYHEANRLITNNPALSKLQLYYLGFFSYFLSEIPLLTIFTWIQTVAKMFNGPSKTKEAKIKILVGILIRKSSILSSNIIPIEKNNDKEDQAKQYLVEYFNQVQVVTRQFENMNKFQFFYIGRLHAACPSYDITRLFGLLSSLNKLVFKEILEEKKLIELLVQMFNTKVENEKNSAQILRLPNDSNESFNDKVNKKYINENLFDSRRTIKQECNLVLLEDEDIKIIEREEFLTFQNKIEDMNSSTQYKIEEGEKLQRQETIETEEDEEDLEEERRFFMSISFGEGNELFFIHQEDVKDERSTDFQQEEEENKTEIIFDLSSNDMEIEDNEHEPSFYSPTRKGLKCEQRLMSVEKENNKNITNITNFYYAAKNMNNTQMAAQRNQICGLICSNKSRSQTHSAFNELCGHNFHQECLKSYLESQIREKIFPIECPHPDCFYSLRLVDLMDVVSQELTEKYINYSIRTNINQNVEICYCPTPGCFYAFSKGSSGYFSCPLCKKGYCFNCHSSVCKLENKDSLSQEAPRHCSSLSNKGRFKVCPRCSDCVEKLEFTNLLKCKCGLKFCYECCKIHPASSNFCFESHDFPLVVQPDLFHRIMQTPESFKSFEFSSAAHSLSEKKDSHEESSKHKENKFSLSFLLLVFTILFLTILGRSTSNQKC